MAENVIPLPLYPAPAKNGAVDGELVHREGRLATGASDRDVSTRLLNSPVGYIRDHFGEPSLLEIAAGANIAPEQLDDRRHWISWRNFADFLEGVFELLGSDEAKFKIACTYKDHDETYGPLRFVTRDTSPALLYELVTRMSPIHFSFGKMEIVKRKIGGLTLRYTSDKHDSRLMCLSRQATGAALPTLWGLSPAVFTETSCIARGDASCTYEVRWKHQDQRWLAMAVGMLLGGSTGVFLTPAGVAATPIVVALSLAGGGAGYGYRSRRKKQAQEALAQEMERAYKQSAYDEARLRDELLTLREQSIDWSQFEQQQASDQSTRLDQLFNHFEQEQKDFSQTVRDFSKSLRDPIGAIRKSTSSLRANSRTADLGTVTSVDAVENAVDRVERLLCDLIDANESSAGLSKLVPQKFTISEITNLLRSRLKALVYGRDIRVSVFSTRDAPGSINIDMRIFDAIASNLLTNAAKFTSEGSIVLELDGEDGYLVIKISDTGAGILKEQNEAIFQHKESNAAARISHGYGLGLPAVVQLLAAVGGRMDVISSDIGTTFCVFLPTAPKHRVLDIEEALSSTCLSEHRDLVSRIVNIRTQEES